MNLVHAYFTTPIATQGDTLPTDIQWMPPGEHEIDAWRNDSPARLKVNVTARVAEAVAASLQAHRSRAAAGADDLPYLDFNHEDREASAHVLEVYWGGDDPVKGGVRAKVQWTEPGRQALLGRAYRRFSPSFYTNAAGEVTGAPINMGGLVNKAAFKTIAPIRSRDAGPQPKGKMTEQEMQAAVAAAQSRVAELEAKLRDAESTTTIKAKDSEIAALKTQITQLEDKLKAQARVNAKLKVEAAVKAGKLPPQATELHAKWVDLIAADEANAALLEAMESKAPAGQIVTGGSGGTATATSGMSAADFKAAVESEVKAGKTKSQALDLVIAKRPELYQAWRAANGQPAL